MNYPFIRTAGGHTVSIPIQSHPAVAAHFANPTSYAGTILNQINQERLYAPIFEGKRDLAFLDIGANVGMVSAYAHDVCSRIVAAEPCPEHFVLLRMLVEPAGVKCVALALGPTYSTARLYRLDSNTTGHTIARKMGAFIEVTTVPLVYFLSFFDNGIDVVKVDIEGAECEALTLAQLSLCSRMVRSYFIEVHPSDKGSLESNRDIIANRLTRVGYRVEQWKPDTLYAAKP